MAKDEHTTLGLLERGAPLPWRHSDAQRRAAIFKMTPRASAAAAGELQSARRARR